MVTMKRVVALATSLAVLFTAVSVNTKDVAAKSKNYIKLNYKKVNYKVGESKTLKVKKSLSKKYKVKSVKVKTSNSKVTVSKNSKFSYQVKGKSAGNSTVTVTVKLNKKLKNKKSYKLKCKFTVSKKNTTPSGKKTVNTVSTGYPEGSWMEALKKAETEWKVVSTKPYIVEFYDIYSFSAGEKERSLVGLGTKENYEKIMAKVKSISQSVIKQGMTDQEKAFVLNRYLCENVTKAHSHNPEDCLFNNDGLCDALAYTYALLCQYNGIDCEMMESHKANHAWNVMKMGNYWYITDVFENRALKSNTAFGGMTISFLTAPEYYGISDMIPDDFYLTEDYKKKHPFDTISYYERCKLNGTPVVDGRDLIKYPY